MFLVPVHDTARGFGRAAVASRVLLFDRCGQKTNMGRVEEVMKAMLFIKMLFVTVIFLFLVLMGVYNRTPVDFNLPPLLTQVVKQPAALMYYAFFAVGLITGALLSVGGGKKQPSKSGKPS